MLGLIDNTERIADGVWSFGDRVAISYNHPANRQSFKGFYDGLIRYTTSQAAVDFARKMRSRQAVVIR